MTDFADEQLIEGYPGIIAGIISSIPPSAAGADSQRRHRKNSLAADRRRNRRERTDSEIPKFTVVYLHKWVVSWGANSVKPVPWVLSNNLTAGEIFEQVVRAQQAAEAQGQPLSNTFSWGMGEPLLNYEQVLKSDRTDYGPGTD